MFTINNGAGYEITVSMPFNPRQQDIDYFRRLARGQSVRFYGVALNSQRIELRQFDEGGATISALGAGQVLSLRPAAESAMSVARRRSRVTSFFALTTHHVATWR